MQSANRNELSLPDQIKQYIATSNKQCTPTYPERFKTSSGQLVTLEQFIICCDSIAKLLMNIDVCCAYITNLEKLLTDQLSSMPNEKPRMKVLRNILEKELSALGFYPKFGKAITSYSPGAFFSAMKSGLMIKDGYEGYSDHGEFSHIIQWLIIAWHQNKTNFLGLPASDVFKMIGVDQSNNYQNVWDMLFEAEQTKDFRSPETLHKFICGKEPELALSPFPALSKLILERRAKRSKEYGRRQLIESNADGKYNSPLHGPGYFTPIGFDEDTAFAGKGYQKFRL